MPALMQSAETPIARTACACGRRPMPRSGYEERAELIEEIERRQNDRYQADIVHHLVKMQHTPSFAYRSPARRALAARQRADCLAVSGRPRPWCPVKFARDGVPTMEGLGGIMCRQPRGSDDPPRAADRN